MTGKAMNLVVGAGLSGATAARLLAVRGETVTVVDSRPNVGGNAHDALESGILIHKYGPHIFHTDDAAVWRFLGQFATWLPYEHKVLAMVDGQAVPLPLNLDSLRLLFPRAMAERLERKLLRAFGLGAEASISSLRGHGDPDLAFLASYAYERVFLGYTAKMWGKPPEEVDPNVMARVSAVRVSRDGRYFRDPYQGLPMGGYTALVARMLDHPNIELRLGTPYDAGMEGDRLFWTGSVDEFFGFRLGMLPYRSLRLEEVALGTEWFQPAAVVNHPCDNDFTRVTEHKRFLMAGAGPGTVVTLEYPCDFEPGLNERLYPVATPESARLYGEYGRLAGELSSTYFLGRLGGFRYLDMDKAVARVMALVASL